MKKNLEERLSMSVFKDIICLRKGKLTNRKSTTLGWGKIAENQGKMWGNNETGVEGFDFRVSVFQAEFEHKEVQRMLFLNIGPI